MPDQTEGRFIYDLGNRQWDIPALRQLLEDILSNSTSFDDYVVEQDFQTLGHKKMLLNARRLDREPGVAPLILLAIEEVVER